MTIEHLIFSFLIPPLSSFLSLLVAYFHPLCLLISIFSLTMALTIRTLKFDLLSRILRTSILPYTYHAYIHTYIHNILYIYIYELLLLFYRLHTYSWLFKREFFFFVYVVGSELGESGLGAAREIHRLNKLNWRVPDTDPPSSRVASRFTSRSLGIVMYVTNAVRTYTLGLGLGIYRRYMIFRTGWAELHQLLMRLARSPKWPECSVEFESLCGFGRRGPGMGNGSNKVLQAPRRFWICWLGLFRFVCFFEYLDMLARRTWWVPLHTFVRVRTFE